MMAVFATKSLPPGTLVTFYNLISQLGGTRALLVGRQNCNLQVMDSSPGWTPLHNGRRQATYTCVPLVTKQYNLVPAKGVISLAGKVTVGLVESNGSLPPGL